MPPPFKPPLLVVAEDRGAAPSACDDASRGAQGGRDASSWQVQADGAVCMQGKSLRGDYVFCRERGLIRAGGQDAPLSYKVNARDIVLVKQLGAGACATVHKGFHTGLRRFVAVKRVRADNDELRQQMLRDIRILADAQAVPGLTGFLGAYLVPDRDQVSQMAIVLEYMDGGTLADVLKKLGRLPEDVLAVITGQLLQGLAFMHGKHMVHRDIKPANILLSLSGAAKLSDFGISGAVEHTYAQCMTYAGTVTYMSPERLENKPYNFTADIWSLGLVLAECLAGRYPYDADCGPAQLIIHVAHGEAPLPPPGSVSDLCRDFLAQCLCRDPARRPPAAALLSHPWVAHAGAVDLRGLLRRTMFDPDDRVDEIGYHFAYTYYSLLSDAVAAGSAGAGTAAAAAAAAAAAGGGAPAASLAQLAPLYLDHSVLTYQGTACQGRAAILAQLQQVVASQQQHLQQQHLQQQPQQHGSIGFSSTSSTGDGGAQPCWQVAHIDCQPLLQTGCAVLHVTGRLAASSASSAACFVETFILARTPGGEFYVANQAARVVPAA